MEQPPQFSNYPREMPPAPGQEMRPPGVYFDTIGKAWGIVSGNLGFWVAGVLIMGILGYGSMMLFVGPYSLIQASQGRTSAASAADIAIQGVLGIIPSAILLCFVASLNAAAVKQVSGFQPEISDVFRGFRRFGALLGMAVIVSIVSTVFQMVLVNLAASGSAASAIIVLVGVLVAFALAIWIYPTYMFVPPHLVITGKPLADSAAEVFGKVSRFALPFFALNFVMGLLLVVSALLCCVPLLFTLPIQLVVIGMHYRYFFSDSLGPAIPVQIGEAPPQ